MKLNRLTFFIILWLNISYSQNSQWQQFGLEEGLPQLNITALAQDQIGYLWLGTQGSGLVRFDGNEFKTYGVKDSLPSRFVNSLFFRNDSLFVATNRGLGIYHSGKIFAINTPKINKIIPLHGKLYLASDSGIYAFKENYVYPLQITPKVDINSVTDIEFYENYFFIETPRGNWKTQSLVNAKGVTSISNEDYTFNANQKKSFGHPDLNEKEVQDMLYDQSDNLWIATKNNGLLKYTQNNFQHFTTQNGLASNQIYALTAQQKGLWVATGSKGIQFLFGDSFINSGIEALKNISINSMALDTSKNLWLGSQSKGLILLKHKALTDSIQGNIDHDVEKVFGIVSPSFEYIPIGEQLSNVSKTILQVVSKNNLIWVADGHKIHQLTTTNGIVNQIESFGQNQGLRKGDILCLSVKDDQVYYGTAQGNLGVLKNNQLIEYYQPLGLKIGINSIIEKDGFLYLGTKGKGVWLSSIKNPKDVFPLQGTKKLNSNNINQLLFDKKGHLWIGTEKGLNKVLVENNTIKDVFYFSRNDGFSGIETINNSITESDDGTLWFGTKNGLTKLNHSEMMRENTIPTIHFESIDVNYRTLDSISSKKSLQLNSTDNSLSFHYKSVDLNHPNAVEYSWKIKDVFSPWTSNSSVDFANLDYGSYQFVVKSRNRDLIESKPIQFLFTIEKPWYLTDLFIIAGIGILFISGGLLVGINTRRLKRRSQQKIAQLELKNKLIGLEQKALQLQMNPHFMFNVLNGIKAMGTLGKTDQMSKSIQLFAKLLRGVLDNSREEFVSMDTEIQVIESYMILEQQISKVPFDFSITYHLDQLNLEEVLIPPMLIQPFVENSVKHAFKAADETGKINISFTLRDGYIYCEIKDNGIGYLASKQHRKSVHKSAGIEITKNRLYALNKHAHFTIQEIKKEHKIIGTSVRFNIPYKLDY